MELKKILVYIIIILIIFFFSCSILKKNPKDNYLIGINSIKTLNPFLITTTDEQIISNLIHGSLFSVYEDLSRFSPFLASGFKVVDNKIIIKIQKNIYDSSGNRLDVVYLKDYFNYFKNKIKDDNNLYIPDIGNFQIDNDDENLILKFSENISNIDIMNCVGHLFTFPILSPEVFSKFEKDSSNFYQYGNLDADSIPIISTGRWKIKNLDRTTIELEKIFNKEKTLTFQIIKDNNLILQKLINKEIDICFGDQRDFEFLKKFYSIKTQEVDNPDSFYVLLFNFQSSNSNNRVLINDINFRKKIYNILSGLFNSENYITASHSLRRIRKYNIPNVNLSNLEFFSLFSISDDLFSNDLNKSISEVLSKNGLNINSYDENLNSMIARIYATKNWDFFITALSTNFPFLIDFDLYNPFSYQHIFNINIDNNIDLILPFESELYQEIQERYFFILNNPRKIYKEIEEKIIKSCYFIPLMQGKLYVFADRNLGNIEARLIRKAFYLKKVFD